MASASVTKKTKKKIRNEKKKRRRKNMQKMGRRCVVAVYNCAK